MLKTAIWYFIAWVIISIGAAALQGLYKTPIYNFCMDSLGKHLGMISADSIVMIINSTISFWIFFPILKIIFKSEPKEA